MGQASFADLIRRATDPTSRVQSLPRADALSPMRSAPRDDIASPRVRMQLVEVDGFWQWQETTGAAPDLGRFRGSGLAATKAPGDAIEIEFSRLAPSQVIEFLHRRDRALTPQRGLRRLDPHSGELRPADPPPAGRALVLIHGTFSCGENILSGLQQQPHGQDFLARAASAYDGQVFVYDHPTLAVSPVLNAIDLHRHLAGSTAAVDFICHSRGGLVARWWCEMFDPGGIRCEKAVLVGAPLAGTALAAPPNIRESIDLLTQLSRALQLTAGLAALAVPVFSMVEVLLRVLTSITRFAARTPVADAAMAMVPGLSAMSRVGNNPELTRLLDAGSAFPQRYCVVRSNFESADPQWRFWQWFRRDRIIDSMTDALFPAENDLVVDTTSMDALGDRLRVGGDRMLDFGTTDQVHHLNYFAQRATIDFLARHLLADRPPAATTNGGSR